VNIRHCYAAGPCCAVPPLGRPDTKTSEKGGREKGAACVQKYQAAMNRLELFVRSVVLLASDSNHQMHNTFHAVMCSRLIVVWRVSSCDILIRTYSVAQQLWRLTVALQVATNALSASYHMPAPSEWLVQTRANHSHSPLQQSSASVHRIPSDDIRHRHGCAR